MPYYERNKDGKLRPLTKKGKLKGYLVISPVSNKVFATGLPRFRPFVIDEYFENELSYREMNKYADNKWVFLGGMRIIHGLIRECDYMEYFSQYKPILTDASVDGIILPIVKSRNVNCLLNHKVLVGYTVVEDLFGDLMIQTMQCECVLNYTDKRGEYEWSRR